MTDRDKCLEGTGSWPMAALRETWWGSSCGLGSVRNGSSRSPLCTAPALRSQAHSNPWSSPHSHLKTTTAWHVDASPGSWTLVGRGGDGAQSAERGLWVRCRCPMVGGELCSWLRRGPGKPPRTVRTPDRALGKGLGSCEPGSKIGSSCQGLGKRPRRPALKDVRMLSLR